MSQEFLQVYVILEKGTNIFEPIELLLNVFVTCSRFSSLLPNLEMYVFSELQL